MLLADTHAQAGVLQDVRPTAATRNPARQPSAGLNIAAHGLRGVASVMVLLAHIMGGTARHIYPDDGDYARLITHPWNVGTFGVEIFFVISGFVILPSVMRYSLREFALRRFLRLYPLFFTLSALFVILNHLTNAYPGVNNLRSIVAGFLFLNLFTGTEQLTPNAWSLSFEVFFYILTALVAAACAKRPSLPGGIAAVAAATAFLLAFPITVYFLIGIAMRVSGRERLAATPSTRRLEAAAFALLIGSASLAHFDYTSWIQFQGPIVPLILLSMIAFFRVALMRDSLTARLLGGRICTYLGDVSYSLYLVHPFVYYLMRALFVHQHWFTPDIAASMLRFGAAVIVLSLAATHVVHRWLELWPYQAFFHQGIYHKRVGAGA